MISKQFLINNSPYIIWFVVVFIIFTLLLLRYDKEKYSNLDSLQINPAPYSDKIEPANYYHLDDQYTKGDYPQTSKIDLGTYINTTEPTWVKMFKWC